MMSTSSDGIERGLAYLASGRNGDGGWGYAAGQTSMVEPAAAVLLAARAGDACGELCQSAATWLQAGQHADGGWGMNHEDPESGWHTAWAVLALARLGQGGAGERVKRGVTWLLGLTTPREVWGGDQSTRAGLRIDLSLQGWPWLPHQANWVEPTSLAVLAMAGAPLDDAGRARLAQAARFLGDRRCAGGGWNFGNPVMLGADLPPRAHPTAWALLALARVAPRAVAAEDVAALRAEMARDRGVLAQAWGLLALGALGEAGQAEAAAVDRLQSMQGADGSWNGNPYHTAVAMLALRGSL